MIVGVWSIVVKYQAPSVSIDSASLFCLGDLFLRFFLGEEGWTGLRLLMSSRV